MATKFSRPSSMGRRTATMRVQREDHHDDVNACRVEEQRAHARGRGDDGGECRAGDGCERVDHQQRGRGFEEFRAVDVVVGVGDRQRIERQHGRAEEERQRIEQPGDMRAPAVQERERHAADGRRRADAGDDPAPVQPIRYAAQRNLDQRAAEHESAHEDGNARRRKAEREGINRPQRPEGAVGEADRRDARHADRRHLDQTAHAQFGGRLRRRLRQERHADGHHAKRIKHGREAEEFRAFGRGDRQQPLPQHDRAQIDRDIGREDASAVLVGGAVVQPALDHHVGAGGAEAEGRTHDEPRERVNDERVNEDGGARQRGRDRESADVAHAREKPRDHEAAGDEAAIIERTQKTDFELRETFERGTQRHERVRQAVAEEQKGRREKNRADRIKLGCHSARRMLWPGPSRGLKSKRFSHLRGENAAATLQR